MGDEIDEESRFKPGQIVVVKEGADALAAWDGVPGRRYEIEGYAEAHERDTPDEDPPYYIVNGTIGDLYGGAIPHDVLEAQVGPWAKPHYAEFVAIKRVILQCDSEDEADLLDQMTEFAQTGSCAGMAVTDEARPLLIHDPYGSESVGPQDGGASMFAGNAFGDDKAWMRELGEKLIVMSKETE